ncbi:hypothetical protein R1flu_024670 [Riccia fluitans]|uniref:Glabrous enhancer-binding protein-like DBD domain-containing protein n=1 Tax=Riccia fluitans TaxID=41844 RepID=A0ABD1XWH3_9MARC
MIADPITSTSGLLRMSTDSHHLTINKKKVSPPPESDGGTKQQKPCAGFSINNLPLKLRSPFTWTANLELALAKMLFNEKQCGRPIPSGGKNDPYWPRLVQDLVSEGVIITAPQLSEKTRRMKKKWKTIKEKGGSHSWKHPHEQKMFKVWDRIWGTELQQGLLTTSPCACASDEEEEKEVSEEEGGGSPEAMPRSEVGQKSKKSELSESEEVHEVEPNKGRTNVHDGRDREGTASHFVSKD